MSDEEQRRLEEIRRKAEEDEERRIEEEVQRRTESLKKLRGKKKRPVERAAPSQREEDHRRREEDLKRREEEQQRREVDMERRQREDEDRRKTKDEETLRQKEENEKRRREEEERRKVEQAGQRRIEEENRERRDEEERQRKKVLKRAEEHLAQKEFDRALAETANVLAVDPTQRETLALDKKIRNAKAEYEARHPKEAEPQPSAEPQAFPFPPVPAPTKSPEVKVQPEEKKVEERKERPPVPRPPRKPLPKGAIAGAAVAILVIVGGILIFRMSRSLFEGKRYIAVLPFAAQSNTEDERVLGPALAEEVALMLSHFPDARVMGPSTAVNLQRRFRDARLKANQLKFPYTLTGTISAAGQAVSLNLTIVDTLGNRMWSGRLERARTRIMELPAELMRTLGDAFEITLPDEYGQLMSPPTSSSNAYLAYLRGRRLLHRGTASAASEALSQFLQAAAQDPSFAEAHAAAGHAYFHLFEKGWNDDPAILIRAEEAARKALSVRSPFAEARTVLGGVSILRARYREALRELDQSVASLSSNSEAERLLGDLYAIAGSESKAFEHLNSAYALDPVNVDVLTSAALVYQRFAKPKEAMGYVDQALPYVGDTLGYLANVAADAMVAAYQYDRAIAVYEERVALDPSDFVDHYRLARAYQLAGRDADVWSKAFERTISLAQRELQSRPQNALASAYLGLAYSRYGRFPEGEANAKKAAQTAPGSLAIQYKLADIYSIQKKKTEALNALRQATRSRYMLQEIVSLDLFNVSGEPEFAETISQSLD